MHDMFFRSWHPHNILQSLETLVAQLKVMQGATLQELRLKSRGRNMVWRKRKQKESLPWYRSPKYNGNLTEDEKRELDSFRLQENSGKKHPAASYDDIPNEVQMYISKIQIENYDQIQDSLASRCLLVSGVGAFLLLNHFGWVSLKYGSTEVLLFGAVLLLAPWFYYPIKWRKNADKFSEEGSEGIRMEWELEYIANKHMGEKGSGTK